MNPRSVNPVALAQLQAWETIARGWPVRCGPTEIPGSFHVRCVVCGMTVFPVTVNGVAYDCTLNQVLAGLVAHLRNVHRDIEREVYRDDPVNGIQDTESSSSTGIASGIGSGNFDPD